MNQLLIPFLFAAMATLPAIASQPVETGELFPPLPPRTWIYNYTPEAIPADSTLSADADDADLRFFDEEERSELFVAPDDELMPLDSLPMGLVHTGRQPATRLQGYWMRPVVFDHLRVYTSSPSLMSPPVIEPLGPDFGAYDWINEEALRRDLITRSRQHFFVYRPDLMVYNEAHLPEPPKRFTATVDPETATVVFTEIGPAKISDTPELTAKFDKKHWLKKFDASLQFSQAYISPNWYQGGNNNVNALLNLYYNVRLNPAYHPKWKFENTLQYKLGINNAPDDKVRDYNISEDLFQWNMTVGYKSTRRWYYSLSSQFKTQFLNNYKSNSHDLKAAFLSPGELNVGLGMTYSYTNPKKTITFDASISPLSWNMKTCISHRMDETAFGIKAGRHTVSEIGSSAECKFFWQMCDNISLRSRLFVFTDYDYAQGDWENTLSFNINRFLSTQIFVHLRYDSTTPPSDKAKWHKWQLKEILSFGFAYKFATP